MDSRLVATLEKWFTGEEIHFSLPPRISSGQNVENPDSASTNGLDRWVSLLPSLKDITSSHVAMELGFYYAGMKAPAMGSAR